MNGKFWLSVLAGTILYFLLAWLIWGMLLADFYGNYTITYEGLERETPLIWAYLIGSFGIAFLVGFLIHKGQMGSFSSGFTGGFVVGAMYAIATDFSMHAGLVIFNDIAFLFIDTVVSGILTGIVGAIMGVIMGARQTVAVDPTV